ncbi:Major facilitator superfamily domain-containing protein 8 [Halocaridina rubra]|uniref:Major facilitator superfamily domain-containing protein 8 n=1 Tax=Halocaridina rubra TaxID=373956 RepID=A0AAN9AGV6_HALRR
MPSKEFCEDGMDGNAQDGLIKPNADAVTFTSANNEGGGVTLPILGDAVTTVQYETNEERKARRRSHYVVYFTTFIGSVGFSIVLTGVWPYVQQLDSGVSKEFLGWVIAVNPLGQMLASPLLGLWANKAGSSRGPLLFTVALNILGNALYAILSVFGSAARAMMVFARFLVGVSFANMAIIRSYIAASTTTSERTSAVAFTSAAQGCGFIIGPALQAAIAVSFASDSEAAADVLEYQLDDETPVVEWNMYTAAGWSAAFLGFINFFLFLPCVFQEHHIAAKEAQFHKSSNETNENLPKPDYLTVVSSLVTFYIVQFVFVLIEVLLVPLCIDMYAWSDETTLTIIGVGLCIAGLVATAMFASVGTLAKKFDERKLYIWLGLVPLLLSMGCFFPVGSTYPKIQNCTYSNKSIQREARSMPDVNLEVIKIPVDFQNYKYFRNTVDNFISEESESFSNEIPQLARFGRTRRNIRRREKKCSDTGCPPEQEWCKYTPIIEIPQLVVACFIAFIGYPVAFSMSSSLYSKLLGPKPQGVWMGILTSTGSLSRMTGPIFVSYMYTTLGTRWTFGLLFFVMIFTVLLISLFFRRLVPMKITST